VELKLGETIITAFVAKLVEGMPARIAAINEQYGDIEIRPPVAYFTGRKKDLPETPAVFVMEGRGQFIDLGAHSMTYQPEILVSVIESDSDMDALSRRLQRQARAILEVLWDDDPKEAAEFEGGRVTHIRPLRTQPGVVFDPESETKWRGFYTIVFRAKQEEL
jgi:hypothetical protein